MYTIFFFSFLWNYDYIVQRKASIGFLFCHPASKLSPKKWGLSGGSSAALVAFLGGVSFLLTQGVDIRPNLAAILGLAIIDAIFLGGSCLAQISSYWPPYRRRILVHEAGHLLTGNLCFLLMHSLVLEVSTLKYWHLPSIMVCIIWAYKYCHTSGAYLHILIPKIYFPLAKVEILQSHIIESNPYPFGSIQ